MGGEGLCPLDHGPGARFWILLLCLVELTAERLPASWTKGLLITTGRGRRLGAAGHVHDPCLRSFFCQNRHSSSQERAAAWRVPVGEPLFAAYCDVASGCRSHVCPPTLSGHLSTRENFFFCPSKALTCSIRHCLSEAAHRNCDTKPQLSRAMGNEPFPWMITFLKHWSEILPLLELAH